MDSSAMSLDEIIKKKKITKGGFRNGKPAVKPKKTAYVDKLFSSFILLVSFAEGHSKHVNKY